MRIVHFIIRISKSKLSKWLRFGAIKQNIKSTLKSTIDPLHDVCPLKVSREIISKSLHDIICKDKVFREQSEIHNRIFNWFEEKNSSEPSRPYAVFKKRVYSSVFFGSKVFTIPTKTENHFSTWCMGMDISDVDLQGFCLGNSLYDRQTHGLDNYDISSTGKTFIHAPVDLLRTMFGNKMAHGILIDQKDILKEVNETKEGSKQKIMKLVLREYEDLIQLWRSVKTT
ncbi:9441_t:CDS:2 [Entrophospora sp. SA101]|nr:9441_t:CDS:2 [Entrophospora sp. SA101]